MWHDSSAVNSALRLNLCNGPHHKLQIKRIRSLARLSIGPTADYGVVESYRILHDSCLILPLVLKVFPGVESMPEWVTKHNRRLRTSRA